jgi:hypothetical protein
VRICTIADSFFPSFLTERSIVDDYERMQSGQSQQLSLCFSETRCKRLFWFDSALCGLDVSPFLSIFLNNCIYLIGEFNIKHLLVFIENVQEDIVGGKNFNPLSPVSPILFGTPNQTLSNSANSFCQEDLTRQTSILLENKQRSINVESKKVDSRFSDFDIGELGNLT